MTASEPRLTSPSRTSRAPGEQVVDRHQDRAGPAAEAAAEAPAARGGGLGGAARVARDEPAGLAAEDALDRRHDRAVADGDAGGAADDLDVLPQADHERDDLAAVVVQDVEHGLAVAVDRVDERRCSPRAGRPAPPRSARAATGAR